MGAKHLSELRSRIAEEAARLILEHGESDYQVAKRKAAQALGVREDKALPNGSDIDAAVRARQSLFGVGHSDEWRDRVVFVTLEMLREFSSYDARLVGGLAAGMLTPSSGVDLHLFSDDAKSVAIDLLNLPVRYQSTDRDVGQKGERLPGFEFEWDGVSVTLSVFPLRQARHSYSDQSGRKGVKRLSLKEASALLQTI